MWSALGKYKAIVVSIALFLILDASVLSLNFFISFKIADDAVGVNLAGRQRMLTQRTVKSLYDLRLAEGDAAKQDIALDELKTTYNLFNTTLAAFDKGGETKNANGETVVLKMVTSDAGRVAIDEAKIIWQPYSDAIAKVIAASGTAAMAQNLDAAIIFAGNKNLTLLKLMNDLTVNLEQVATHQATVLRYIQTGGITLAIINFLIILFHFIGELRQNDKFLEDARKETTDILDTVNEGLFLLDKDLVIGEQQSSQLAEIFGGKDARGLNFSDLIGDLVKPKDLETAQRFVNLLFRPDVKGNLINDLNPLNQVEINIPDEDGGYITRHLSFDFSRVSKDGELKNVLVTVNDITEQVMLARELEETKEKGEQQLEMLTSILHANPGVLKRFIQNAFDAYGRINKILKEQSKSPTVMQRKLNDIFIEVHNFKGEASALELDNFAEYAHVFEDDIQTLKQQSKLAGNDFLKLAVHLESLIRYTESIKELADKLASFAFNQDPSNSVSNPTNHENVTSSDWKHLSKLCENVSQRDKKQAQLVLTGFDEAKINDDAQKLVNELSIQFIRNAVVHSIEHPEFRKARGKNETGRIDARLSRLPTGELELSVHDDGCGINYEKIRSKALMIGKWDKAEVEKLTHQQLLSLIFLPGFSTADNQNEDAGRGVGMDIIKKRIDQYQGKIKVSSSSGKHCQFTVTFPADAFAQNEINTQQGKVA